jgi:hypothetical protein
MYELNILRSFLVKENYKEFRNVLKDEDFGKEMRPILDALDLWYKTNTVDCSYDNLVNLFFSVTHREKEYYKELFDQLAVKQPLESTRTLLEGFRRQRLMEALSSAAYEASTGRRSADEIYRLVEDLKTPIVEEDEEDLFVTDDLDVILDETLLKPGLRWRLNILNRMLGSLRKGTFGFLFARPEVGKTAFICSEVTYMAGQLKEDDGPILWFNLEEEGNNVKFRQYQSALGWTKEEILANRREASQQYQKLTHGKIKLHDSATVTRGFIEKLADRYQPSLIVIDQLDKVYGFQNDREDLRLGQIYVWAREIAKRYCPVIGVSQAGAEGEGREFLTLGEVSNSKTSKAAEADWILGIGARHDAGVEFVRGLSAIKNKLLGDADTDHNLRHGKVQVLIKPRIQRYIDIG